MFSGPRGFTWGFGLPVSLVGGIALAIILATTKDFQIPITGHHAIDTAFASLVVFLLSIPLGMALTRVAWPYWKSQVPSPLAAAVKADLSPSEVRALSDAIPRLLEVARRWGLSVTFHVEMSATGMDPPPREAEDAINSVLTDVTGAFRVQVPR